jgi:predicted secreted hydrolase
VLLLAATALAAPAWRPAGPGHAWEFPRDHHVRPEYRTEWWYVTGHLVVADDPGAEPLGFQQTFFRQGLVPAAADTGGSAWTASDLVMAHASLTDAATDRHLFAEVLWRAVPALGGFGAPGDSVLAWCRAPAGTPGRWSIVRRGDGTFVLDSRDDRRGLRYRLACRPLKPLVFHGDGGYSPKSADGSAGSLYFSATRMAVRGTVWRGGTPLAVSGQAWLDREIFTSTLAADQTGWDWLSLQLDDGRELMVYRLRGKDGGADFALGTLVAADGTVRPLRADAWTWEAGRTWTSPATGAAYPVAWRLRVPEADLDLELAAIREQRENVSERTAVHYWEGAVTARAAGRVVGRGYVELTGYGEDSRPPLGR